jgi:hypothetical protein
MCWWIITPIDINILLYNFKVILTLSEHIAKHLKKNLQWKQNDQGPC